MGSSLTPEDFFFFEVDLFERQIERFYIWDSPLRTCRSLHLGTKLGSKNSVCYVSGRIQNTCSITIV